MSHRLPLAALAAATLVAAAAGPAAAIPPPPREAVITSAFYEALQADDAAALAKVVAPGAVFHVSAGRREDQDLAAFRRTARDVYGRMPDAKRTVEDLISGRDRVTVRYRIQGTYDLGPAGSAKIDVDAVDVFRLEAGRVAELWHHLNHLMYAGQLGLKFTWPAEKR